MLVWKNNMLFSGKMIIAGRFLLFEIIAVSSKKGMLSFMKEKNFPPSIV
jgi:hypothetical protein